LNNPLEVEATCPYCRQPLQFRKEEAQKDWDLEKNQSGQRNLAYWYFYCGCMNGKVWTWDCEKGTEKWKYHDWKSTNDKWKKETPIMHIKERVEFT
jgi:uncharacterized protein YbaR (Trm112 family)